MRCVLAFLCFSFIIRECLAQQTDDTKGQPEQSSSFTYVPLENRKEDLACIRSYWPIKEDAFIADLHSTDITKWAIILMSAKRSFDAPTNSQQMEPNATVTTSEQGILGNEEALEVLDEMETLKNYVDERHVIKSNDYEYRYINVCLSYTSPTTNRTVCHFPDVNLVQIFRSSVWQSITQSFQQPTLYPYYGDKGAPLGVKMITGPLLGDVEIDRVTGQARSVKSIALRYFFRTLGPPDDMGKISMEWRNSLRDYILNKYASNVINVLYVDDDLMKMRLDEKSANPNLAARLLDPTPSASSPHFWSDGLTAQLLFNAPIDLSREAEVKRVLKTLAAFENTPFTFGEEGTVCWIRAFLAWRKWLVSNLYGVSESKNEKTDNGENNDETSLISTPFGSFKQDLSIFLKNPNYPVYSKHVVLNEASGDGQPDLKAFRCLITLKNLSNPSQRKQALQYLREIALRYPGYNISVVAMDFFPPVTMSAPPVPRGNILFLVVLAIVTCILRGG